MRRTAALIVGGGPAGAAAAIGLARAGLPHLLVERQQGEADALCGGFLSWRSLATLERSGIVADTLNRDRIDRVRIVAGGRRVEATLPRPALAVSRRRLDAVMLAAAERAGASIERGVAVREIVGRTARLADGAAIAADALFLASGKHDVRGLARPAEARGDDPTLGLRVRLPPSPAVAGVRGAIELHLFDRGYAGLALQEDGSANLCLAVHRSRLREAGDPAALLAELADALPLLGERMADLPRDVAVDAIANVPYGWRLRTGEPGLFRLGDQAGVIPSLAGEGMGIAVASGIAAAEAYAAGGADAAAGWQASFARRIARPIRVADAARALAENQHAALLLPLLRPPLVRLLAAATRVSPRP